MKQVNQRNPRESKTKRKTEKEGQQRAVRDQTVKESELVSKEVKENPGDRTMPWMNHKHNGSTIGWLGNKRHNKRKSYKAQFEKELLPFNRMTSSGTSVSRKVMKHAKIAREVEGGKNN